MALMKLCRCGKKIPQGNRYCLECTESYEQRKNNTNRHYDKKVRKNIGNEMYDKFYHSNLWAKCRAVAIARDHALCQDCLLRDNRVTMYHVVHHVIDIKKDYNKRLSIDNIVCLCEQCHQLRHRKDG